MMEKLKDKEIVDKFKNNNEEFRLLFEMHDALERELKDFDKKAFLTSSEEIERKKIQKRKLLNKDKMYKILSNSLC